MEIQFALLSKGWAVGMLATLIFDGWLALQHAMGLRTLNFALLGRWIGHFRTGQFRHVQISQAQPVTQEWWLGILGHYGIGIFITELLIMTQGQPWLNAPTLPAAIGIGSLTVAFPWLIMQPGMGGGIAFSNTAQPLYNCMKSLFNHAMFGLCMYLAGKLLCRMF